PFQGALTPATDLSEPTGGVEPARLADTSHSIRRFLDVHFRANTMIFQVFRPIPFAGVGCARWAVEPTLHFDLIAAMDGIQLSGHGKDYSPAGRLPAAFRLQLCSIQQQPRGLRPRDGNERIILLDANLDGFFQKAAAQANKLRVWSSQRTDVVGRKGTAVHV